MQTSIEQLANDLQGMLDGFVTPGEFRARHPITGETGPREVILCLVAHYLDDFHDSKKWLVRSPERAIIRSENLEYYDGEE